MLYKYVRPERIDILQRKRIRFTQPSGLNDPFELRPYFEVNIDEQELTRRALKDPSAFRSSFKEEYDRLPAHVRESVGWKAFQERAFEALKSKEGQAMTAAAAHLIGSWARGLAPSLRDQLATALEDVGILSLTKRPDSGPMWAHYGADNSGFVIGFDDSHRFFNRSRSADDQFFRLRQVVYRKPREFLNLGDLEAEEVLVSKEPEWAYEREWRMLAPVAEADERISADGEEIYLFELPPSCVRTVILGTRASEDFTRSLRQVIASPLFRHVELYRAALDLRRKRIRAEPLV